MYMYMYMYMYMCSARSQGECCDATTCTFQPASSPCASGRGFCSSGRCDVDWPQTIGRYTVGGAKTAIDTVCMYVCMYVCTVGGAKTAIDTVAYAYTCIPIDTVTYAYTCILIDTVARPVRACDTCA